MATEDEILRAYEAELRPQGGGSGSNRGFWLVMVAFLAAAVFLVVEILAHRPLANSIGHAQETLRRAAAAAESIREDTGGFAEADADGLAETVETLRFRPGHDPSFGLDVVSVAASDEVWAGAVRARPGACFYLRLGPDEDPSYGSGTECTGDAALTADQPRW